ncbi:Hypothetical protein POVR2_LOCUS87 [uncultured virus]|nr:Hypothetical protein POVR2_LOCUS87 [uncultured virus]
MPNVERSDSANMIVLDNRISVEDLQISLLRTFVWILREKLIDKILGFMIGSDRVGCPTCEEELGEMIEGKSVYSLLCRYILLKRPKSSDLILWIAEWDHSDLRTATRALAQNIQVDNPSIMAMRELIRVLIQPSLTLEDILYDLGLDNASNETLELTGKLLGLYYGRRSIIEQEMN